MRLPTDLLYSKDHAWLRREGVDMRIGLTHHAEAELGKVMFVELPSIGDEVTINEAFGSVEAEKAVSELYAPISGTVVEVNERLTEDPEQINSSPYEQAWMIVLEPSDDAELDDLLTADQYEAHVSE